MSSQEEEEDDWETDPDYVNDMSEEQQRYLQMMVR